jgi:hypothetical protein
MKTKRRTGVFLFLVGIMSGLLGKRFLVIQLDLGAYSKAYPYC